MKSINVTRCEACPYRHKQFVGQLVYCQCPGQDGRLISDVTDQFPTWCPLPDVQTAVNQEQNKEWVHLSSEELVHLCKGERVYYQRIKEPKP